MLRQGLAIVSIGIVVGLLAAWPSSRVMSSMLFEVSAHDPATYGLVTLLLLAVSILATYLPARRAAALDPVEALRSEG
jgi:ABC-type antimicrobial peptide transport system permease subunit